MKLGKCKTSNQFAGKSKAKGEKRLDQRTAYEEEISISEWNGKQQGARNKILGEKAIERCVEGFIACEEGCEGQYALSTEFLDH